MRSPASFRSSLVPLAMVLAAACSEAPVAVDARAEPAGTPFALVDGPSVVDPELAVRQVVGGLVTPVSIAFLNRTDDSGPGSASSGRGKHGSAGPVDMLVTEKNTGRVMRVTDGVVVGPVLDLAVNTGSERGLLGMALAPGFPADPGVYLYWTESSTGADTPDLSAVPLLGNRVDRFVWNGSTLAWDRTLVRLRAFQADAGQPLRGNHDGGVIAFGPDGKLYVFIGDVGRRGQMQNLACGPTPTCPPVVPDDQFGGPQPDAAHLTGVVLRLNPDGTSPTDNPFHAAGAAIGGDVGTSLQRVWSYGHRNAIGMAFSPLTGDLWLAENGDDSFSELNRVDRGMNGGWVQFMGPVDRIAQFKAIETTPPFAGLQQIRWNPVNTADTPAEALGRLFMLPGARYVDPVLAWKWEVAPGGIGFVAGNSLGGSYRGDLIMGAARPSLEGGHLFRIRMTGNGRRLQLEDPRLADGVADNLAKFDGTESESLLWGRNWGVVTDVEMAPDGTLYLVSLSNGAVYEVSKRR